MEIPKNPDLFLVGIEAWCGTAQLKSTATQEAEVRGSLEPGGQAREGSEWDLI